MDVGCPLKLYNDLHTMLPYSHRKKKSGWSLTNVKKKQMSPGVLMTKSMPVRACSIYYISACEFLSSPCTSSDGNQRHQTNITSGVM